MASQGSQPFHWHYAELDDKNFQVNGHGLLLIVILFSILLLFTFLFLYARWVCRYRQLSASAAAFATSTPPPPSAPSLGLDPATISRLPISFHRSSANTTTSESDCSICLTTFQDEDKVKVLPLCLHAYHPDCVDKWLTTQSSCPLCRASLRPDSHIP